MAGKTKSGGTSLVQLRDSIGSLGGANRYTELGVHLSIEGAIVKAFGSQPLLQNQNMVTIAFLLQAGERLSPSNAIGS